VLGFSGSIWWIDPVSDKNANEEAALRSRSWCPGTRLISPDYTNTQTYHGGQVPVYTHMHHEARDSFSSLPRRVGKNCNTFDHWGSGATGCLPRAHSGQGALRRQTLSRWVGPSTTGWTSPAPPCIARDSDASRGVPQSTIILDVHASVQAASCLLLYLLSGFGLALFQA